MASNNLNTPSGSNIAVAGLVNKAAINALVIFSLIFLTPSAVHADMLFDFQMKMAKKGGNPEAEFKVGEMYETGFGVKKDMAEADKWITKAANQGHETAGFKLLYWDLIKNGRKGVNIEKVAELRNKAKAGNPQAEYYIGKMYANGVGYKQNPDKAIKWLQKAAMVGVLSAERELTSVREIIIKQDLVKKKAIDKKREQQRQQAEIDANKIAEAERMEAEKALAEKNEAIRVEAERESARAKVKAEREAAELAEAFE